MSWILTLKLLTETLEVIKASVANNQATCATVSTTSVAPFPKALDVNSGSIREKFKLFWANFDSHYSASRISKRTETRNDKKVNALLLTDWRWSEHRYDNFKLTNEEKLRPVKVVLDIIQSKLGPDDSILLEWLKLFLNWNRMKASHMKTIASD